MAHIAESLDARRQIEYSSLIRQFNLHGFRKTSVDGSERFHNKFFQRDRKDLQPLIRRKMAYVDDDVATDSTDAATLSLEPVQLVRHSKRPRTEMQVLKEQVKELENGTVRLQERLAAFDAENRLQREQLDLKDKQLQALIVKRHEESKNTQLIIDDTVAVLRRYCLYSEPRFNAGVCVCSLSDTDVYGSMCVCGAAAVMRTLDLAAAYEDLDKPVFFVYNGVTTTT